MKAWVKYVIVLLIGFLMAYCVASSKNVFAQSEPVMIFHILSDSFIVPGVLLSGFGLLIFVSNEGAFDILTYGVRSFLGFFKKNPKREYETFYDYKVSRASKKLRFGTVLVCGLFFLLIAVIMYYIYSKY